MGEPSNRDYGQLTKQTEDSRVPPDGAWECALIRERT
jgi:hypothetical protein